MIYLYGKRHSLTSFTKIAILLLYLQSKASGSAAAPSVQVCITRSFLEVFFLFQFSLCVLNMVKLCQPASNPASTVSTSNSNPASDPPVQTQ